MEDVPLPKASSSGGDTTGTVTSTAHTVPQQISLSRATSVRVERPTGMDVEGPQHTLSSRTPLHRYQSVRPRHPSHSNEAGATTTTIVITDANQGADPIIVVAPPALPRVTRTKEAAFSFSSSSLAISASVSESTRASHGRVQTGFHAPTTTAVLGSDTGASAAIPTPARRRLSKPTVAPKLAKMSDIGTRIRFHREEGAVAFPEKYANDSEKAFKEHSLLLSTTQISTSGHTSTDTAAGVTSGATEPAPILTAARTRRSYSYLQHPPLTHHAGDALTTTTTTTTTTTAGSASNNNKASAKWYDNPQRNTLRYRYVEVVHPFDPLDNTHKVACRGRPKRSSDRSRHDHHRDDTHRESCVDSFDVGCSESLLVKPDTTAGIAEVVVGDGVGEDKTMMGQALSQLSQLHPTGREKGEVLVRSPGSAKSISPSDRNESFTDVYSDVESRSRQREVSVRSSPRSTWLDQLLATLNREMIERRRAWGQVLLEILIPLLCVICTVVLWAAFGDIVEDDAVPFFEYRTRYNLHPGNYRATVCYNDTWNGLPHFVMGLAPCSAARPILEEEGLNISCPASDAVDPEMRVKGVCFESSGATLMLFMSSAMRFLMEVPPLDDVIAHHWMARYLGTSQSASVETLISAGLATNNRYSAISSGGMIYFAPQRLMTEDLMRYMVNKSVLLPYVFNGTFETVEEAHNALAEKDRGRTWALVILHQMDSGGIDVEIQMSRQNYPSFSKFVNPSFTGGFVNDQAEMYLVSGFASLYRLVMEYYLTTPAAGLVDANRTTHFTPYVVETPSVAFWEVRVLSVAESVLGFVVVLAFLYPVVQSTRRLVVTKEQRIREAVLIMGLRGQYITLSWMLHNAALNFVISILMTIILRVTFVRKSDPYCVFLVIFGFALTTVPLSGLFATFFSRSRMAALLTPLIYFALAVPIFAMNSASPKVILALSIFSPTAFAALLNIVFACEGGEGFSAAVFNHRYIADPTAAIVLGFYAVDFVVYLLLMLYLEEVLPREVGSPRHPLFFISDAAVYLWGLCRSCGARRAERAGVGAGGEQSGLLPTEELPAVSAAADASSVAADAGARPLDGRDPNGVFEEEATTSDAKAVDIVGLRKTFRSGRREFVAVNNLYWSVPDRCISVLLGHNGAGKSTALHMITGMLAPDGGDCFIYGKSVRNHVAAVRQEIGFCPQHNILWPGLTCREHLEYFAQIKGLRGAALEDAVWQTLREVDLLKKADCVSSALSGGQKRKLSVAIAFVGGSRLVFLDEPTAGMDVAARRHTWELLLRLSRARAVLLTTHFMDEADLLGDRIAIMGGGRLKCSGSSLFLKSRMGVGYNITMSVQPSVADVAALGRVITSHIPEAEVIMSNGCEVSYRLPTKRVAKFSGLLAELEVSGSELGVCGYALSATTLEEIFLKVAEEDRKAEEAGRTQATTTSTVTTISTNPLTSIETYQPLRDAITASGREDQPTTEKLPLDNAIPVTAEDLATASTAGDGDAVMGVTVESSGNNNTAAWDAESLVWNCEIATSTVTITRLQFAAMFQKRLHSARRDTKLLCFQVLCPTICVVLAMLLNLVNFSGKGSVLLSPDNYPHQAELLTLNCDAYFNSTHPELGARVSNQFDVRPLPYANVTDLHNYMFDNWFNHGGVGRYSAIACDDPYLARRKFQLTHPAVVMYNSSSVHEVMVGLSTLYNLILQSARLATASPAAVVRLTASFLPSSEAEKTAMGSVKVILMGIIILIPFTFLPSNCVAWIVKERECKSRHLQDVSGLNGLVYWTTNYTFDMALYMVTLILVLVIFAIFQRWEYVGADTIGGTVALFLIFGLCSTATAYVIHFAFSQHSSAQTITMVAGFATGFLLVIIVFILALVETTRDASEMMQNFFRVIPTYAVGEGIINLSTYQQRRRLEGPSVTLWSVSVLGGPCLYMGVEIPIFVLLTLFIDHPYWRLLRQRRAYDPKGLPDPVSGEDTDVEDERAEAVRRVRGLHEECAAAVVDKDDYTDGADASGCPAGEEEEGDEGDCSASTIPVAVEDAVSVIMMKKEYPDGKVAVRNLTFGVVPGEVFGFLGTNGAGKTTTISILCQEFLPTCGQVVVCGYDIITNSSEALQCIGYCPQFDATLDLLTVEEHLRVFAGIRAVVAHQHTPLIEQLMALCGLTKYRDTLASELSGGNRRKLSVALAIIGGPQVVFLDEPSAGMDPVARRALWTSIQAISERCSVVLTTHHLEEVEALADCVAIMVDGSLRCIGDKTHLKQKYGTGFEMNLRIGGGDAGLERRVVAVEKLMGELMPGAALIERRGQRLVYALPPDTLLSDVFDVLQKRKEQLHITDYSVSQTSIEQVFMRISEEAEESQRIHNKLTERRRRRETMEARKSLTQQNAVEE